MTIPFILCIYTHVTVCTINMLHYMRVGKTNDSRQNQRSEGMRVCLHNCIS